MGLRLRLLLLLILPLVIAVAIYGVVRIRQQAAQLLETERKDAAATVRAVQIAVENALRDLRLEDIRRLGAEMVSEHAQIDGLRIYDDSLAPITAEPRTGRVDVEALRRVLASGRPETRFTEPGTFHYLLPLRGGSGSPRGVLEMSFRSTARERVERATKEIVLSVSLLTLGLALFTALILQRQVLRPLSRLTASIRALGAGRPGPPLPVERRDELGVVAEAFNGMVAQLDAARRQVESASEHMLDLEQQLRRAATLAVAGKLTSSIAHEVGTPLNIVSGRAELLMHSLPDDHPGRQELGVIIGQIDRISGIIRSLLDTVRPQKPEVQPVVLRDVLDRLLPLLQHVVRRRGVELAAEVPADLPAVAADPGQLQQVLINLLMNAIEATPAGGRIGLCAWAAERDGLPGVAAAVTDTGTGIAPAALGRVFEPFFTTKPSGQGTGLGLSICRDIVREHGGTLTAESREGDGATFTLWLPRHEGNA